MRKEIKETIDTNGKKFYRITTIDERWYGRDVKNPITGLPEIVYVPSVTWIMSYYYVSPYLVKWIADKGLTEAERIRDEAGTKGDKIHQATEDIDKEGEIKIDAKYLNKGNGEMEELSADEIEAIVSYKDFIEKFKPKLLANEMTTFGGIVNGYGGTLDRIWRIDGQIWIIDLKSSQSIRKSMLGQIAAYSHADIDYKKMGITDKEWEKRKLAILQLGYKRNKNKFKFTEIDDRIDLFDLAYKTWKEENPDAKPKQRDFPMVIRSEFRLQIIREATMIKPKVVKKVIKKTK